MKVVFNGTLEKHSKGCNCKGVVSEVGFVQSKMYILPSGVTKTFYVGKPETVTQHDGEILLSYIYTDLNGDTRPIFSEV